MHEIRTLSELGIVGKFVGLREHVRRITVPLMCNFSTLSYVFEVLCMLVYAYGQLNPLFSKTMM